MTTNIIKTPYDLLNLYIETCNIINSQDIQFRNMQFGDKEQELLDEELKEYDQKLFEDSNNLEFFMQKMTEKSSKFEFVFKLLNTDPTTNCRDLIESEETFLYTLQLFPLIVMEINIEKVIKKYGNSLIENELRSNKDLYVNTVENFLSRQGIEQSDVIAEGIIDTFIHKWFENENETNEGDDECDGCTCSILGDNYEIEIEIEEDDDE